MKSNYFNSPVITPLVKASTQHNGEAAMSDGDIVFDWTSFEIPRGVANLVGATMQLRHNKVASQAAGIDLVFVRDTAVSATPTTIGVGGGPMIANFNRTDIIGYLPVTDFTVGAAAVNYQTSQIENALVLEPEPNSGSNVGVDKYWVAGLASGALDLQSLVAIGPSAGVDISGSNGTFGVIDGTAPDLVFAAGDILHAEDDIIIGEIASLDTDNIVFKFDGSTSTNHAVVAGNQSYTVPADIAAWRIQNGADAAGDLLEDDLLYNIYPIRLTLHFSK